jgi:C4-dicarboxylate-specific signal transduction histidine kinase
MIVVAILLTWIVIGASYYWLGNARLVVSNLSTVQAPNLAQTSRLSAQTTDIAMLSNRILSEGSTSSSNLEALLKTSVSELIAFINDGLDTTLTPYDAEILQRQLLLVIRHLSQTQKIEIRIRNKIEQLRWLNVDVQDEAAAVMADFAYNIEVLTRRLAQESNPSIRTEMAKILTHELQLQSIFSNIGNDTATGTTLAMQISTSQSSAQLDQFEDLIADALARINVNINILPSKPEYQFIRQASETLELMTTQPNGLVHERKAWHQTRQKFSGELDTVMFLLKDMQTKLLSQAETQRAEISLLGESFSENAAITLNLLLAMTIGAAAGGLAILFYYIRPSIIQPMENLTTAMRQIADGKPHMLNDLPVRDDEISHLEIAVNAFQNSVTERDQAIQDLHQTQNELVQVGKMAALGNLSAGISHELNQPLGAIRQRLRLAQKATKKNDTTNLNVQLTKIDDLVNRIERIILHLRRFARRSEYLSENVSLERVFTGAQELLSTQLLDHQIMVNMDPSLKGTTVVGDAILVEQVLVNLLSNSCDAIIATGGKGEILIRKEKSTADQLVFSIIDTGIGLGNLEPERAFEPFVTTKDPNSGLGLGLSISFNIITGMNGTLTLAARADVGTRATVTMPLGKKNDN